MKSPKSIMNSCVRRSLSNRVNNTLRVSHAHFMTKSFSKDGYLSPTVGYVSIQSSIRPIFSLVELSFKFPRKISLKWKNDIMHSSLITVLLCPQSMEKCSLRRFLPEMKPMTWSTKHSKLTWKNSSLRQKKIQETSKNPRMFNKSRTFIKKTT